MPVTHIAGATIEVDYTDLACDDIICFGLNDDKRLQSMAAELSDVALSAFLNVVEAEAKRMKVWLSAKDKAMAIEGFGDFVKAAAEQVAEHLSK